MNLYELYDYAVDQGIDVDWYTMPFAKSFSIFIPSLDRRAIALDPWKFETVADEFTTLGHEVGHCMTYSFYNRWAACDVKKKHENRADKWEIEQFLPPGRSGGRRARRLHRGLGSSRAFRCY